MKVTIVDKLALDLAVDGPEDLRNLDEPALAELATTMSRRSGSGTTREEQDAAVLAIVAQAKRHVDAPIEAATMLALDRWMSSDEVKAVALEMALRELDAAFYESLLRARNALNPRALPSIVGGLSLLPDDARVRLVIDLGNDPDEARRLHLLEIFCRHRRLLPPGSIKPVLSGEACKEFVRIQALDPSAAIRERVIAAVYAWGKVFDARETILMLTSDPSLDVRQYALVALGTLTDEATLQLLLTRLANGSVEEATSAIWALARRPDGLPHVLALLPNQQQWVTAAALGAIKSVSAPLDDTQLDTLRRRLQDADVEDSLSHHVWRTRDPQGKEYGPDGAIMVVRH